MSRLIVLPPAGRRENQGVAWLLVQTLLLLLAGCTAAKPLPTPASPVMSIAQTFCAAVLSISHAECESLVNLYENTDGLNWKTKNGWLTDTMPCTWVGVTCIEGRIEKLNLRENGLRGPLPTTLNGLRQVRHLYIARIATGQFGRDS